jgi:hypothetical protein
VIESVINKDLLCVTVICRDCTYIAGIRVFNQLPQSIKILVDNKKSFKVSLKRFLYHHSFYSMQEYYQLENKMPQSLATVCIMFLFFIFTDGTGYT